MAAKATDVSAFRHAGRLERRRGEIATAGGETPAAVPAFGKKAGLPPQWRPSAGARRPVGGEGAPAGAPRVAVAGGARLCHKHARIRPASSGPRGACLGRTGGRNSGRRTRTSRRDARFRPALPTPHPTERCRSGRSGRSRKPEYGFPYRGFESHPLRQYTQKSQEICRSQGIRGFAAAQLVHRSGTHGSENGNAIATSAVRPNLVSTPRAGGADRACWQKGRKSQSANP